MRFKRRDLQFYVGSTLAIFVCVSILKNNRHDFLTESFCMRGGVSTHILRVWSGINGDYYRVVLKGNVHIQNSLFRGR